MKFHNLDFSFFIPTNLKFMISGCHILDLASHSGESSICCSEYGAISVLGVEPRQDMVTKSIELANIHNITNVTYTVGDATDRDQMLNYLKNIDTVITFGMFYHIADHNLLLRTICESEAKHVIIETEYGPETSTPGIDWYVENTDSILAGYNNYAQILAGAPNLKWINECLTVYGWKIVYYKAFYRDSLINPRQRMILAAVNLKHFDENKIIPLPDDLWEWHIEPNQMVAKEFIGINNEI
jgi:hypothetical protein